MHKRLFLSITLTALVLSSCGSGDKTYNGIYNLKDGYTSISVQGGPTWMNTNILEDGSNLSGGEKSRIIIARALVKNSSIIIFDETFSAINKDDANNMIKNILDSFKNKTFIII